MKREGYLRGFIIILCLVLLSTQSIFSSNTSSNSSINSSFSTPLNVIHNVQEQVSVTKLLDGRYTISVIGEVEIINPSYTTEIYEYRMRAALPDGIFGGFTLLQNSSSRLNDRGFYGYFFQPSNLTYNSSLYARYSFSGILTSSQFERLEFDSDNQLLQVPFLEAFTNPIYVLKPSFTIDKPIGEHEQQTLQDTSVPKNVSFSQKNVTSNNIRAVGSKIINPTEFNMFGYRLEMIRTRIVGSGNNISLSGTFLDNRVSLGVKENFTIDPFQTKEFGFYDNDSDSNSVYWVELEVSAMSEFFGNISLNYREQQPSSGGGGGGGGGSSTVTPPIPPITPDDEDEDFNVGRNLVITKSVDKFFVTQGEEITVTIRIMNLGRNEITNLSFKDLIPDGYSLVRVNNANLEGRTLNFLVDSILGYSEVEIQYVLVKDSASTRSFTFFPPVDFDGDAIVEGVLVLEDILGETNLFVQKEVKWLNSQYSQVTITVRNVGNSRITNFKVLDELNERYLMREISTPFSQGKRGLWEIESLAPGGEWKVTYTIENHQGISQMPLILGAEDTKVYTTLILNSHVSSTIQHTSSSIVEKIGLGFAIILVLAYILF
ncbi:MAG: DUF11 domain-containing protein [Nanoarchaeota archaeon]|nr:DUF11 domain-containing protein [Nanoarchaeota archaeon]